MKTWYTSLPKIIILNIIGIINYIARSLLDWRYVYPDFIDIPSSSSLYAAVFYLVILGVWFWAIIAALKSNKIALITMTIFNLIFLLGIGLGTYYYFCPSPCSTIWPISEIINISNIVFGLLIPYLTVRHLWFVRDHRI